MLTVFLAQSPNTARWYFAAQSFVENTIKGVDGESFTYLSPRGSNDMRTLPASAIKSAILPIEWNSLSRADVEAKVGATAQLNHETGELVITATPKKK